MVYIDTKMRQNYNLIAVQRFNYFINSVHILAINLLKFMSNFVTFLLIDTNSKLVKFLLCRKPNANMSRQCFTRTIWNYISFTRLPPSRPSPPILVPPQRLVFLHPIGCFSHIHVRCLYISYTLCFPILSWSAPEQGAALILLGGVKWPIDSHHTLDKTKLKYCQTIVKYCRVIDQFKSGRHFSLLWGVTTH